MVYESFYIVCMVLEYNIIINLLVSFYSVTIHIWIWITDIRNLGLICWNWGRQQPYPIKILVAGKSSSHGFQISIPAIECVQLCLVFSACWLHRVFRTIDMCIWWSTVCVCRFDLSQYCHFQSWAFDYYLR